MRYRRALGQALVRTEITAGNGGNEVLPVTADLGGQAPYLRVRGHNPPTTSIPVTP